MFEGQFMGLIYNTPLSPLNPYFPLVHEDFGLRVGDEYLRKSYITLYIYKE